MQSQEGQRDCPCSLSSSAPEPSSVDSDALKFSTPTPLQSHPLPQFVTTSATCNAQPPFEHAHLTAPALPSPPSLELAQAPCSAAPMRWSGSNPRDHGPRSLEQHRPATPVLSGEPSSVNEGSPDPNLSFFSSRMTGAQLLAAFKSSKEPFEPEGALVPADAQLPFPLPTPNPIRPNESLSTSSKPNQRVNLQPPVNLVRRSARVKRQNALNQEHGLGRSGEEDGAIDILDSLGENLKSFESEQDWLEFGTYFEMSEPVIAKSSGSANSRKPHMSKKGTVRDDTRDMWQQDTDNKKLFLTYHREVFLPLLPSRNYVSSLTTNSSIQPGTTAASNAFEHESECKTEENENRTSDNAGEALNSSIATYVEFAEQPQGLAINLKPYQLKGLSFLAWLQSNGMSGILADEMGLGKTLQTLSFLQHAQDRQLVSNARSEATLLICPLTVLNSWIAESRRFTPRLKMMRFHGPPNERKKLKAQLRRAKTQPGMTNTFDAVVTTYETLVAEENWFKRSMRWKFVILDEGHTIKNPSSITAKALRSINASFRLILTGTPVQNDLFEMWALLNFLYPDVFCNGTETPFKKGWNLSKALVAPKFLESAHRLLQLIMLRRMKDTPGVDLNLPPKKEVMLFIPLTPFQQQWYCKLITSTGTLVMDSDVPKGADQAETGSKSQAYPRRTSFVKLMNLIMQLRKVCGHPFLFHDTIPNDFYMDRRIVTSSAKFIVLEKILQSLVIEQGRKVLIFSLFTGILDLCEELLEFNGGSGQLKLGAAAKFGYLRLDGDTTRAGRNLVVKLFQQTESAHKVMLISTKAGGLGLTLTAAKDVVIFEEDWNPQVTLQAEDRAHRIGQDSPVTVYKLCTRGTVEEQMRGRIQKKLYLSSRMTCSHDAGQACVANGLTATQESSEEPTNMSSAQLKSLIRRGTQTVNYPEVSTEEMLEWDFDTLLAKCQLSNIDVEGSTEQPDVDEEKWLAAAEKVKTNVLSGTQYTPATSEPRQVQELDRAERRVGKETTVNLDGFQIYKENLKCDAWEAVPTLAGKDPSLADQKRRPRAEFGHQKHCQVCYTDGDLVYCAGCPRAYHGACLEKSPRDGARGFSWWCTQHHCIACSKSTVDAGGMLFRCTDCEQAYCEDCFDWSATQWHSSIRDSLPEFEDLGYGKNNQACYILCHACEGYEKKKVILSGSESKSHSDALFAQTGNAKWAELDFSGAGISLPLATRSPSPQLDLAVAKSEYSRAPWELPKLSPPLQKRTAYSADLDDFEVPPMKKMPTALPYPVTKTFYPASNPMKREPATPLHPEGFKAARSADFGSWPTMSTFGLQSLDYANASKASFAMTSPEFVGRGGDHITSAPGEVSQSTLFNHPPSHLPQEYRSQFQLPPKPVLSRKTHEPYTLEFKHSGPETTSGQDAASPFSQITFHEASPIGLHGNGSASSPFSFDDEPLETASRKRSATTDVPQYAYSPSTARTQDVPGRKSPKLRDMMRDMMSGFVGNE